MVAFGPRKVWITPGTTRDCSDVKPTPRALSLTPSYDQGRTGYDLDLMGDHLTENGLPLRHGETGVAGLVVDRAYTLTDSQARVGGTPSGLGPSYIEPESAEPEDPNR